MSEVDNLSGRLDWLMKSNDIMARGWCRWWFYDDCIYKLTKY